MKHGPTLVFVIALGVLAFHLLSHLPSIDDISTEPGGPPAARATGTGGAARGGGGLLRGPLEALRAAVGATCSVCDGSGRVTCTACGGSGRVTVAETSPCTQCNGSGRLQPRMGGASGARDAPCPFCRATGQVVRDVERRCAACDGSGRAACAACGGTGRAGGGRER